MSNRSFFLCVLSPKRSWSRWGVFESVECVKDQAVWPAETNTHAYLINKVLLRCETDGTFLSSAKYFTSYRSLFFLSQKLIRSHWRWNVLVHFQIILRIWENAIYNITVSVFPPLALWQPQFLCLCTTTCICGLKQFVSGQRSLVFLHLQCLTLQKNITSFLLGMLVNNLWLIILGCVVRLIQWMKPARYKAAVECSFS